MLHKFGLAFLYCVRNFVGIRRSNAVQTEISDEPNCIFQLFRSGSNPAVHISHGVDSALSRQLMVRLLTKCKLLACLLSMETGFFGIEQNVRKNQLCKRGKMAASVKAVPPFEVFYTLLPTSISVEYKRELF